MEKLLDVKNLNVSFQLAEEKLLAVRDVSFSLEKGKSIGIVGESGCGKSVSAFSILRLISRPGEIESGSVLYRNSNLMEYSEDEMREVRGGEISMIFQEPMSSLNPVFTIGRQVSEGIILHTGVNKEEGRERAVELLSMVGIPDAHKRYNAYPHEFSGGMRQRAMIAMALGADPSILIADEPTTALDVTIQAQILDLLVDLQEKRSMSLILISHDLGIVANIADSIAIMYAGEIVEYGDTAAVFKNPLHPYTRGLFESIPRIGTAGEKLKTIAGTVPMITEMPRSCVFAPRCPLASEECRSAPVSLMEKDQDHLVRCIKA